MALRAPGHDRSRQGAKPRTVMGLPRHVEWVRWVTWRVEADHSPESPARRSSPKSTSTRADSWHGRTRGGMPEPCVVQRVGRSTTCPGPPGARRATAHLQPSPRLREPHMNADGRQPIRILIFAASLRQGSLNDRLATLAAAVVEQKGGTADRATMRDFDCPSYDGDAEGRDGVPAGASRLRDRLVQCDAFIAAIPEYNASMPGVLKNAVDWTSRIRPQPWNGKQGLLLSASP